MMEENNDIFLAGDDTLVYFTGPMHTKNILQHLLGAIHLVRMYLRTNFSMPPSPCKHMYTFRVTVTAVGLFQKIVFKHYRTYVLNNMTQMLQVNKNSNIKYNMVQVKLNKEDIPN